MRADEAAFVDAAVHSRAGRRPIIHALAGGADLYLAMRPANADRRLCRQQLILVAIELADLSGQRTEAAFHQSEDGDFAAVRGAAKTVALDAELGIRLERYQRIIGEADLGVALCAGHHGVADIDRRAGRQSHSLGPAQ